HGSAGRDALHGSHHGYRDLDSIFALGASAKNATTAAGVFPLPANTAALLLLADTIFKEVLHPEIQKLVVVKKALQFWGLGCGLLCRRTIRVEQQWSNEQPSCALLPLSRLVSPICDGCYLDSEGSESDNELQRKWF
ncbi:MAG: hypothetical protein NZL93_01960, partial [Chthoniobacterales bacterium]|nr:hypothetical protein [Chthoniobacterales bacterium]